MFYDTISYLAVLWKPLFKGISRLFSIILYCALTNYIFLNGYKMGTNALMGTNEKESDHCPAPISCKLKEPSEDDS